MQDPALLPYRLDWAEAQFVAQNDPAGLIPWAIGKILPGVNQFTGDALEKYLREARIDGTPLYEHGFWNLLARTLSPEAYSVARTMIGYDCLGSNANAVDLITEIYDFSPDVKYYLLNDGYEAVPWTLQQRFEAAGGRVESGAWLAGFTQTTFADGSTGVALHFRDGRPSVTARAIVLAMPRRSIELLDREGPVLDPAQAPHVPHLLNSVRPIPLYKLFLAYEYPWWNAVATPLRVRCRDGRSPTRRRARCITGRSIPARKTPPTTGPALLMAYNDATNVDFWEGLSGVPCDGPHAAPQAPPRGTSGRSGRACGCSSRGAAAARDAASAASGSASIDRPRKNWDDHRAPHQMVMEMHRQIAQMHDVQDAPAPVDAAYMDWSIDPFGGGVHFWNRGYKSWEVLEQMTKPVEDFPCYVCGEAYSTNQTWVEGALQTAEIVLQKHFGLREAGLGHRRNRHGGSASACSLDSSDSVIRCRRPGARTTIPSSTGSRPTCRRRAIRSRATRRARSWPPGEDLMTVMMPAALERAGRTRSCSRPTSICCSATRRSVHTPRRTS